jgi:uncharacterized protein YdaU (DUF1376 family)
MHYFSLNIKDYAWATRNYDAAGRLAYLEICMLYVDTEAPLSGDADTIARRIGMPEHGSIVADILRDHFRETKRGFVNAYLEEILKNIDEKRQRASKAAAQASKAAREKRLQRSEIGSEIGSKKGSEIGSYPIPNNPITHDPITHEKKPRKARSVVERPEDVSAQVWADWMKARGRTPLTETAWSVIVAEATKAGVSPGKAVEIAAGHGWRGFKAEWLNRRSGGKISREPSEMSYEAPEGFAASGTWGV